MPKVVERTMIVPNLHVLTVHAPDVAGQILPGQFVIVRGDDDAERIPLSVADWNRQDGTVTMVFMEVGRSTGLLAGMSAGDELATLVGPLGTPTEMENFGTVVCIGGCFGIGAMLPVLRELRARGNRVYAVLEGRSSWLLYWEDRIAEQCERVFRVTRDGSAGSSGHARRIAELLQEQGIVPDRLFANGCTFLSFKASMELKHFNVPVIVTMNTIMIDGTGMCGVCRLTYDGKTKFACVDGPDFDGRFVDWDEVAQRRKQYLNEEAMLVHHSGCGRM